MDSDNYAIILSQVLATIIIYASSAWCSMYMWYNIILYHPCLDNWELVKEGLLVELSEGIDKVQRVFLFYNIIVHVSIVQAEADMYGDEI